MKTSWTIGPRSLELLPKPTSRGHYLVQQTSEFDLLYQLARMGFYEASECALELIFNRTESSVDYVDAVEAYCELPLPAPPFEFVAKFESYDWSQTSYYGRGNVYLWPVILAGSSQPEHKALLIEMLKTADIAFLDAAIQAASSFPNVEFQVALAQLAMELTERTFLAEGALRPLCCSFQRWLRRNQLDMETLERMLRTYESPDVKYMRAERLLNYVVCQDWHLLPFPSQPHFLAGDKKHVAVGNPVKLPEMPPAFEAMIDSIVGDLVIAVGEANRIKQDLCPDNPCVRSAGEAIDLHVRSAITRLAPLGNTSVEKLGS